MADKAMPAKQEKQKNSKENTMRWISLQNILTRPSNSFAPTPFDSTDDNLGILQQDFRILVLGAGGLGCEILKNLSLSGFTDIEIIDGDIVHLSNLSRCCLFRKGDIGQPKAKIAAECIMQRITGCNVKWYKNWIQDFKDEFFSKFNLVIGGLDNIESRRWINSTLCDLVNIDYDYNIDGDIDTDTIIPYIDGGIDRFNGHCRLFIPMLSSCFECSIDTISTSKSFAIHSDLRLPQHCIYFVWKYEWRKLKWFTNSDKYGWESYETDKHNPCPDGVIFNKQNEEHILWIYKKALERANKIGIEGVTYSLTIQIVCDIKPALISTNAIIAAICVNEAFKVLTWSSFGLNNWFIYSGGDGIYSQTFQYKKKRNCYVCNEDVIDYKMNPNATLNELYQRLLEDQILKLKNPSISTEKDEVLFMSSKALKELYIKNLDKKLCELIHNKTGAILRITDPKVFGKRAARIRLKFETDTKQ